MSDTERIIEAVADEQARAMRPSVKGEYRDVLPLTAAIVNLVMSGVCPACKRYERRGLRPADEVFMDGSPPRTHPHICSHPYHDHREALDALLAERGGDSR